MDSKLFVCCYATFVPKIVNIIVLLLLFRFQPTSEKTFLVAVFFLPFFGFILYITGEFQSDIQLWERLHPFENLLCKRRVEMGFPSPNTKTKWKAANLPINSIFFIGFHRYDFQIWMERAMNIGDFATPNVCER